MSKINYKISEGRFSLVMKRIASILVTEFASQITLGNDFLPDSVTYDKAEAVDEGNVPYVGVTWMKFDNQSDFREQQLNQNNFFIDVKAQSYDTVRKIIAIIRTILKSQQYVLLDYDFGIVSETKVTSAGVNFEDMNRSSQDIISGGLTFQCQINEPNDNGSGVGLNESWYELNINETDKVLTLKNS